MRIIVGKTSDKAVDMLDRESNIGSLSGNVCIVAPNKSDRVDTIVIPNLLSWKESLVVLDIDGEKWRETAGYRKRIGNQRVVKFEPACNDGSSAHWNPLAEINIRSQNENVDTNIIAKTLLGDDIGKSTYNLETTTLFECILIHLMYKAYREHSSLPNLADCYDFISKSNNPFVDMERYSHISIKEFLSDTNIFEEIYGNYILDNEIDGIKFHNIKDIKAHVKHHIPKDLLENESICIRNLTDEEVKSGKYIDIKRKPWCQLLCHPQITNNLAYLRKDNSVLQDACAVLREKLAVYTEQNIAENLAYSDFKIDKLSACVKYFSIYLVIDSKDLKKLGNVMKLFCNILLKTKTGLPDIIFKKKYIQDNYKSVLFMLDDFTKLGVIDELVSSLPISCNYNIFTCLTADSEKSIYALYPESYLTCNCINGYIKEDRIILFGREGYILYKLSDFKELYYRQYGNNIKPPVDSDVVTDIHNFTDVQVVNQYADSHESD